MAHATTASPARAERRIGPYAVSFAAGHRERTDEFRLRYQVFVEEKRWESAADHPDGLEHDAFDAASCAMIVRLIATGQVVACQRLVLPERLPAGTLTNVEQQLRPDPGCPSVEFAAMPRTAWAETSRTIVQPGYRWGSDDLPLPGLMVLNLATIALATALNRPRLFSLSEPAMARLVRKLGFTMVPVGQRVDFHGRRIPFRLDVAEMVRGVPARDRPTLDTLCHDAREWCEQWSR